MPTAINEQEEKEFAAAYVNNNKDEVGAFRLTRRRAASEEAAKKGGRRMLSRPGVQKFIQEFEAKHVEATSLNRANVVVLTPDVENVISQIAMSQQDLIQQYIHAAMLDYSDYYDGHGKAKPLNKLSKDQRLQIKDIIWSEPTKRGYRKVVDYVLEDRSKARDQLAKIMGISHPAFDFAGFLSLLTGKSVEETEDEIQRLNHVEGVNFSDIKNRIKQIEGEVISG